MILTTYDTLKLYTDAFGDEQISLLVLQGRGGIGKTFMVEESTKESECIYFNGHATPLSIYLKAHKNPDSLAVFDDVDTLMTNKITVSLLKQICEMKEEKIIRYNTTFTIKEGAIPSKFTSTNKVCLTCNDFHRIGKNIKALLTRAIFIDFRPSNEEVLGVIKKFPNLDLPIFSFLEANSKTIKDMNFRTYIKCVELKKAKLDWQEYLSREYQIDKLDQLALAFSYFPVKERNILWTEETNKSVRNLQRRLKRLGVS